ncbi:DUF2839 domain-containing protein [Microcoleus sp. FACHB-1515]|uniref:DUF2839 domain-containing protein n=1 Tax=Cyanophyceae TaxID=3028117 RepID=UPI0016824177|nr:DUF2839 domain-containing protein [Microcoleus sp. FACHB-1515]MBD2092744.1 DUF2839 domain-containing protein [Microcoleus sp. FACHB-1515]
MGDAKRRKETLGDKYGQEATILPWLPITKTQAQQFVELSTKGAWVGIGLLVAYWVTVRFIGPSLGWWQVQ